MASRDSKLSPIPVLIEYLQSHPEGASIQKITHGLGMNRNLAAKYLSLLHMQGRIDLHTFGNIKIYQISQRIPFHSLSLLSEDLVLGIDKSLCIRYCNGCIEEFFGINEQDLSGKYIVDNQDSSLFSLKLQEQIRSVLEGSVSHISDEECQLPGSSGRMKLVPCIFDDASSGVAFICSRIIQGREQSREYYRLLLSHAYLLNDMQEFYVELSPDWRVANINVAFCEYCRKPAEQIIGTTGIPFVSSEEFEKIQKSILEFSDQVPVKHTVSVILEDGSVRWQEWLFHYHEYEGGKIGYHGFGTDISDRKLRESQIEIYQSGIESLLHEKTEEIRNVAGQLRREIDERRALEKELKKREELYRNLIESTSDIVWEIDADEKFVFLNDRIRSVLGYEPDQAIGTLAQDYIPPDVYKQVSEHLRKSREQNTPFDGIRVQVVRKDGDYAWIEVAGVPIVGFDESFQGFQGVGKDVTVKIVAELKQQQLISIIESTPDLITMGDSEGNLTYLNKAGRKILGISEDTDITTVNIISYTAPEYRNTIRTGRKMALKQDFWIGDAVLRATDGNYIPVSEVILSQKTLPGQKALLSTIARDISDRLNAEEQLARAYAYNRTLIEVSPDPLVTIGIDGKIQDVNHATEIATGYPRENLIGTRFSSYFTEPENAESGYELVFSDGQVRDYPLELRHKDGHIISVLYNAVVYRDEEGEVQGVFAAARDVSKRIKAEIELARAYAYNRTLIEVSPDPLVTIGADGKIQDVNHATEIATGYPRRHLIGTSFSSYFTEPEKAESGYEQVFSNGQVRDYPLGMRHKDGQIMSVLYNAVVYRDEEGEVQGIFAVARDVTERKKLEDAQIFLFQCGYLHPDEDFFKSLARYLAETLEMDFVCVDRLCGEALSARTVAIYRDGKFEDNIEYNLKDTPCGDAVGKRICCFPSGVRHLFPHDRLLQQMSAEGYMGTTLWSYDGRPIGLIAAISRKPLVNIQLAESILNLVSIRAAGELERREAEEALLENEERYRSIFRADSDAIFVIDQRSGAILDANDASCRLFGYTYEEMIRIRYVDLSAEPEETDQVLYSFPDTPSLTIPTRYQRKKNGVVFPVEISASSFTLKDRKTILCSMRDITERKQIEDALRQANRQLHLLSGVVRHDILNKVNVLHLLLEKIKKKIDISQVANEFEDVETTVASIQSQIEFTRIYRDLGTLEPKWHDIRGILSQALCQGNVAFHVHLSEVEIIADPLFERIFLILLENSLIHGETVTCIEVSNLVTQDALVIIWEDNGIGVPVENKNRIFEHGFGKRSDQGLFFTREILSITGLSIRETGKEGKGARFEILVPQGRYRIHQQNVS